MGDVDAQPPFDSRSAVTTSKALTPDLVMRNFPYPGVQESLGVITTGQESQPTHPQPKTLPPSPRRGRRSFLMVPLDQLPDWRPSGMGALAGVPDEEHGD